MFEFLDEDVINNPAYWFLTIGLVGAFLIGFKMTTAWGLAGMDAEYAIPLYIKAILVLLSPVVVYLVMLKVK